MTVYSCGQVRELAPELALGVLGGAERADALIHVNGCARCQALVNELTEAADALPLLAPEIEPPRGFETRVLAAEHAGRRRTVRRWVASVGVAAAAAMILGITIVRVVDAGDDASHPAHGIPVEARMVSAADVPAGWAYVTNRHSVAVAVDYGVAPGRYQIAVQRPRRGTVTIGTIAIRDGSGSWTGRSEVPVREGSTISLVDEAGSPVCRGRVGVTE